MRPALTGIKLPALLLPLVLALAIPQFALAQNGRQQNAAKTMRAYQKHQKKQMKKAARQQKAAQNKWRKQHNVSH